MECAQTGWLSDEEYQRGFGRRIAQRRVPFSGSLDLTHRCDLRCVHCYLGSQERQRKRRNLEMTTEQVISLIDEVTEAGCLFFLITGGEPLLRQDFGEVYRHAKTNGMLVTVFTNGTLITDEIIRLFDDLPPRLVEITLYGATAATYERITGVAGSYERCLTGIQRLLDHGVNVGLKTMLMTLNRHEFFEIENLAREFGVKFRFDAGVFPCLSGDKTPLALRVPPEEVIEKEFADASSLRLWRDYYEQRSDLPASDRLYTCGAGLTTFHIDPYGNLQPCLMTTEYKYDLLHGDFRTGWHEVIPRIRERKADAAFACNECDKGILCGFCPPFFQLENGAEDLRSEYLCAIGHLRFQAIEASVQVRSQNEI
jgi:radical SAM protein with 4Fe4S-binding SPASM domain